MHTSNTLLPSLEQMQRGQIALTDIAIATTWQKVAATTDKLEEVNFCKMLAVHLATGWYQTTSVMGRKVQVPKIPTAMIDMVIAQKRQSTNISAKTNKLLKDAANLARKLKSKVVRELMEGLVLTKIHNADPMLNNTIVRPLK